MTINQVSVFLQNRVGQLAEVCRVLAENDISLVTFSLSETPDYGIARLIVSDHVKAEDALRNAKFIVKTVPVIGMVIPDHPGGMAKVTAVLSENGCDIEYAYAFAFHRGETAVLVFKFKDSDKALKVLKENGLVVVQEKDIETAAE